MRILIIGNGGREHALLWKLARDRSEAEFYVTRPNGGMDGHCNGVDLEPGDVEGLTAWARSRSVDLTVVGPEAPLAEGIVNRFEDEGLPIFGPTREAARIESSKAFAKELMQEAGVPTARHRTFTDATAARAYVEDEGAPIVVKASGLAAGKGAIVCQTEEEATAAVARIMDDRAFGEAGRRVVVEEFMEGEELSIFGITDGEELVLLLPSQDHKPVGEGDTGPNTGGMGAYAPVSIGGAERVREARELIFEPTLEALAEKGAPFRGLLYAGLMLTDEGLRVVEFNCRFGDPEAQVVLPLLESSLLELLGAVAEGNGLEDVSVRWRDGAALTTVVASGGYPGSYEKGKAVSLPADLTARDDTVLFHAGTRRDGERLVTAGGRVLACTGLGATLQEAAEASRRAARAVSFEGKQFRSDIGWRELERSTTGPAA